MVLTPSIPSGLKVKAEIWSAALLAGASRCNRSITSRLAAGSSPNPRTRFRTAPYASIWTAFPAGVVSTRKM